MSWLVEILLPVVAGRESEHAQVRAELLERFGGVTVWSRSPARGLWKAEAGRAETDDIIVYEVLAPELDRGWWSAYRLQLEGRFVQASVLIRAGRITLL